MKQGVPSMYIKSFNTSSPPRRNFLATIKNSHEMSEKVKTAFLTKQVTTINHPQVAVAIDQENSTGMTAISKDKNRSVELLRT